MMGLKELSAYLISGFIITLYIVCIAIWEIFKLLLGLIFNFIGLFIIAVILITALRYVGVI